MAFLKKYIEKQKEEQRQKVEDHRREYEWAIERMKTGEQKVEAHGLTEGEARRMEKYAQQYGYEEEAFFDTTRPFEPQRFRLKFTRKPPITNVLQQLSQQLDIPKDAITVLRIDMINPVECEYCQTIFDLSQATICPKCGGKPKLPQH